MEALLKLAKRAVKLDQQKIWKETINRKEVKDLIIELNTNGQLFEKGERSDGSVIGQLSPFTISLKINKGIPIPPGNRIGLLETGNFYDSFFVTVGDTYLEITADTVSIYDQDLTEVYGKKIIGLSEQSKAILVDFIKPIYVEEIQKVLFVN